MRSLTQPGPPRTRLLGVLFGAALIAATAGVVTYRYANDPTRVAETFLHACRAHDYARLYGLMDQGFQQAVPAEKGSALLAVLNTAMPRACSIVLSGHPSGPTGLVENWHLFHVLVEANEAGADARWPGSFMVVLTQGKDGGWRVAFMPTYECLYCALPARAQAPDLRQAVAWAAGARAPWLQEWRPPE
jgi:hypothetical protein